MVWPWASAGALVAAWQAWAPAAPDELAASLLITAKGGAGEPPVVTVFGAMAGTEADTVGLLGELVVRTGAEPSSTSLGHGSYRAIKRDLAEGDAADDELGHPFSKSEFFRRALPADAIAALVAHLVEGRPAGETRQLDFTPWGGAYNRVAEAATAFAHRAERFLLKHEVVADPGATAAARAWLRRSWALARPWGTGRAYPNFPDPELEDWPRAYHATNLERLVRVKAAYDPDGFFGFEQSLPSALPQLGDAGLEHTGRRALGR